MTQQYRSAEEPVKNRSANWHKEEGKDYQEIHTWIRDNYGSADHCEHCDGSNAYRFEWALKAGEEYSKDISKFIQLCTACHRKYDLGGKRNLRLSKMIVQMTPEGEFIAEFPSLTDAARHLNGSHQIISNAATGRNKLAYGFKWEYKNQ